MREVLSRKQDVRMAQIKFRFFVLISEMKRPQDAMKVRMLELKYGLLDDE